MMKSLRNVSMMALVALTAASVKAGGMDTVKKYASQAKTFVCDQKLVLVGSVAGGIAGGAAGLAGYYFCLMSAQERADIGGFAQFIKKFFEYFSDDSSIHTCALGNKQIKAIAVALAATIVGSGLGVVGGHYAIDARVPVGGLLDSIIKNRTSVEQAKLLMLEQYSGPAIKFAVTTVANDKLVPANAADHNAVTIKAIVKQLKDTSAAYKAAQDALAKDDKNDQAATDNLKKAVEKARLDVSAAEATYKALVAAYKPDATSLTCAQLAARVVTALVTKKIANKNKAAFDPAATDVTFKNADNQDQTAKVDEIVDLIKAVVAAADDADKAKALKTAQNAVAALEAVAKAEAAK